MDLLKDPRSPPKERAEIMMASKRSLKTEFNTLVEVEPKTLALKTMCKMLNLVVLEVVPNQLAKDHVDSENTKLLAKSESFSECLESQRDDLAVGKTRLKLAGATWKEEDAVCGYLAMRSWIPVNEIVLPMHQTQKEKEAVRSALARASKHLDNPLFKIADADDYRFAINLALAGKTADGLTAD